MAGPCMAYRRALLTVSDRSVRYRDRVQRLWRSFAEHLGIVTLISRLWLYCTSNRAM
jgi:hypothetical protein